MPVEMPVHRLGRSGLVVSRLVLGTMNFGDRTSESDALRIIGAARDAGVNFLDTADTYAGGRSEEIVGTAIAAAGCWPPSSPIATVPATMIAAFRANGSSTRPIRA